ncbi:MAG TPA: DUF2442 domain-containing protein [Candidatus Kapabacteria bacterium]|nr:DUF2442 domain-containing protein [Candidatus Kapabacteria bacterium]
MEKIKMDKPYDVQKIEFSEKEMILKVDNHEFTFPLASISKRLFHASPLERNTFEISPSGYGIHWPLIDEDLSIPGLLKMIHPQPFLEQRKSA